MLLNHLKCSPYHQDHLDDVQAVLAADTAEVQTWTEDEDEEQPEGEDDEGFVRPAAKRRLASPPLHPPTTLQIFAQQPSAASLTTLAAASSSSLGDVVVSRAVLQSLADNISRAEMSAQHAARLSHSAAQSFEAQAAIFKACKEQVELLMERP